MLTNEQLRRKARKIYNNGKMAIYAPIVWLDANNTTQADFFTSGGSPRTLYSEDTFPNMPAVDDDGEASMPRSTKPGEPKNPNVSVHSDAPDWWGAEGSGMSSAQAKKDGWGDTFDVWRTEIAALSTAQAWKEWCALYSTDIKALPRGWRVHLREEAELRGKELGAL